MFKEIYGGYQINEEGVVLGKRGQPLAQFDNGRGYLIVALLIGGKQTSKAVHRLLGEAFIPNPDNHSDVNHKDCDKRNNSIDNLEWMTHGNNIKYSYDTNQRSAVGENNARCITSESEVKVICNLLQDGFSVHSIKKLGHDYNLVWAINKRKRWTSISKDYVW